MSTKRTHLETDTDTDINKKRKLDLETTSDNEEETISDIEEDIGVLECLVFETNSEDQSESDICSNKDIPKVKRDTSINDSNEQIVPDTDTDTEPDIINRCIICSIDLGVDNPRQYCGKTYCPHELDN
tara:strand:+ start:984 stop:1367 length:384 start_codon:yes stop_codon:yes gene_type:complete